MYITERKITKIAREVGKFTVRTLKAESIGPSELDFIHAVRKKSGATQAEICAVLGMDKGAAARLTASLESKGYIIRKDNPDDGRSKLLYATELSETLKGSKARIESSFYEWLTEPLSPNDKEEFSRILDIIYRRCKAERQNDFADIAKYLKEKDRDEE